METQIPKPGERYMDTDKRPCQILCLAKHTQTHEDMVVYQALYGEFKCFAKPLAVFMKETAAEDAKNTAAETAKEIPAETPMRPAQDAGCRDAGSNHIQPGSSESMQANPALLQFLDADTLEEKYQIIKSLGYSITNRLIDDFAAALDLVIPDGNVDTRCQQLLSSIRTMQKFETTRLRR